MLSSYSSKPIGLAYAVREIAFYVHEIYQEIDIREILYHLVLPFIVTLLIAAGSLQLLRLFKRYLFPPSVCELHREALLLYQSHQYRESERTLQTILKKDPTYTPARLSLAALYLYAMMDLKKANDILQNSSRSESSSEFKPLQLDLQALQQGQEHMVHFVLRRDEYLSVRVAETPTTW